MHGAFERVAVSISSKMVESYDPQQVVNGLRRNPRSAQFRSVWGPNNLQGLQHFIYKAASAANNPSATAEAVRNPDAWLVQEKLDGVFVLFDGDRLFTKTGNPIPVPEQVRQFLIPGFAFMGELVVGRNLLNNTIPLSRTVTEPSDSWWLCAYIVAFDVLGMDDKPYSTRYDTLRDAVQVWSKWKTSAQHSTNKPYEAHRLPLQVVRQYPMRRLSEVFVEVVHGVPWESRHHKPFGIPQGPHNWTTANPFLYADQISSGEAVMLWDKRGHRQIRGHQAEETLQILKYKPTIVLPGVVDVPPYRWHDNAEHRKIHRARGEPNSNKRVRTAAYDEDHDTDFGGYRLVVRTWDPVRGRWERVKTTLATNYSYNDMVSFEQGKRVFLIFVAYSLTHKPGVQYTKCVPRLKKSQVMAIRKHEMTVAANLPGRWDVLMDPNMWTLGTMRAIFPSDVAWHPMLFCRNAQKLRLKNSTAFNTIDKDPPVTFGGDKGYNQTMPRFHLAQEMTTDTNKKRLKGVGHFALNVLRLVLLVDAWRGPIDASNVQDGMKEQRAWLGLFPGPDKTTQVGVTVRALEWPREFGPIQLVDNGNTQNAQHGFIFAMMRVSLLVVAAVFSKIEGMLFDQSNTNVTTMTKLVAAYIEDTVAPSWKPYWDSILPAFVSTTTQRTMQALNAKHYWTSSATLARTPLLPTIRDIIHSFVHTLKLAEDDVADVLEGLAPEKPHFVFEVKEVAKQNFIHQKYSLVDNTDYRDVIVMLDGDTYLPVPKELTYDAFGPYNQLLENEDDKEENEHENFLRAVHHARGRFSI